MLFETTVKSGDNKFSGQWLDELAEETGLGVKAFKQVCKNASDQDRVSEILGGINVCNNILTLCDVFEQVTSQDVSNKNEREFKKAISNFERRAAEQGIGIAEISYIKGWANPLNDGFRGLDYTINDDDLLSYDDMSLSEALDTLGKPRQLPVLTVDYSSGTKDTTATFVEGVKSKRSEMSGKLKAALRPLAA